MMEWLAQNQDWVFGGIGTAIVLGVGGWMLKGLFKRGGKGQQQKQEGGDEAQQVQVGEARDVTVIFGGADDGLQELKNIINNAFLYTETLRQQFNSENAFDTIPAALNNIEGLKRQVYNVPEQERGNKSPHFKLLFISFGNKCQKLRDLIGSNTPIEHHDEIKGQINNVTADLNAMIAELDNIMARKNQV